MMKKSKLLKLAAAATAVLLAAGCASNGGPDDEGGGEGGGPTTVTVAFARNTVTAGEETFTYAVPKKLGFFEEEGLEVDMVTSDGSTAAIQALASGSADVAYASSANILAAIEQGVPVKAFAALTVHWPYYIGVPSGSDISSIEDLKGKRVGVISLASASYSDLKANLAIAGLSEDDVEIIPVGSGTSAAAALQNGEIDAVDSFTDSFTVMGNSGVELELLDRPAELEELFSVTMATTDQMLEEHPDELAGFVRAAYKGIVYSQVNQEEALALSFEEFSVLPGASDPEGEEAQQTLEAMQIALLDSLPTDPAEDPEEWGDWLLLDDERWQAVIDYALMTDQITTEFEVDEVWDGSLSDQYLDFDRTAVANTGK
ncbi:ABC transporter substrate-binding protein [Leucobacter sp. CSA1]|uniref:ABC transporter substrate-binding protein n=1 Tax=Leucobacter chromiisoli TaxID=2796471 RepID=A0A934QAU7_9MICO|nr:ABC transporter substrate-binding protein [Leucobacter chromiisoli]MBK0419784.1 ABC transporter substrate-binding protein [Leucobacter chromiisoli]